MNYKKYFERQMLLFINLQIFYIKDFIKESINGGIKINQNGRGHFAGRERL